MIREAQQHEREDQRRRELAEARNNADSLIYTVEKSLKELGERVPATDRGRIETVVADLRDAIKGDDIARIRSLTEQLQQASYALSQQLYQQQSGTNGKGAAAGGPASGDDRDVVEGEYRQV